ncbi:MAG: hypothetical protein EOP51_04225 [Sphingobacteriales bacterium]|nr:MAG: hypothetical protein EOP51_04225 [Sphingobacteriales bacterium]
MLQTLHAQKMKTVFEQTNGEQTATYSQIIDFYTQLDKQYGTIVMKEAGATDVVQPLHVVYYNNKSNFNTQQVREQGGIVLLINNGIHPGEPDGIDASMMLLRDVASGKVTIPDNVLLAVVPVFNIGGMLNRGSYSRANQNGPQAYGFRGNAQNYDLNRDFIKMDAKETRTLVKLFHELDPEVFVDNHVSNGADYQHIMTLLTTQHNKLGGKMGSYMNDVFEPMLYKDMKTRGYDLVPYVNYWGDEGVDKGWEGFYDYPRFTSGFASLFQTMAFVPETHMLKPYKQRVESTYALMESFIKLSSENAATIKQARASDRQKLLKVKELPLDWKLDKSQPTTITFKGFADGRKPSEVSGTPRLYYDRSKPYTKEVPFYNTYTSQNNITIPKQYIISQGWGKIIERLQANGVAMTQLDADKEQQVTVYYIEDLETAKKPYEGHYIHSHVKLRKETKTIQFRKGDYVIETEQPARRYIIETLEPEAPDAFFTWGFFDAVLQQKEHFSAYVFEDEAAALLKKDAKLKQLLEDKKQADTVFAKDGAAQLEFIYMHSPYYEPTHNRYPVFRVEY